MGLKRGYLLSLLTLQNTQEISLLHLISIKILALHGGEHMIYEIEE